MSSVPGPDTAAAAVDAVSALAAVGWEQVDPAELPGMAAAAARIKNLADAVLVKLAGRLEETGAAEQLGWASAKDFLTHATGGRRGAGATYVRVAARTVELPVVRSALRSGDLSLTQASAISNAVATLPFHQPLREGAADKLVDLACEDRLDATDLTRHFPTVVKELDPDGTLLGEDQDRDKAERGAHAARYLSIVTDDHGGGRLKGYGTIEDLELTRTTLMPLTAPVTTEPGACGGDPTNISNRDPDTGRRIGHGCPDPTCFHDGKDHRDHGARMFDALTEACRRLQADDAIPHAHGTTARITLTTDYRSLREGLDRLDQQPGLLTTGDSLSAAAVRRLACDAEIIPAVLGSRSEILDVGRTQRLVTTGIWNALVLRDQHCRFPGCQRLPLACDAHHVTHWADGGPTSLDNLLLLCRKHHTVVHTTPWTVSIEPDTRQPVWSPPPPADDADHWTYRPAVKRRPHAA